MKMKSAYKRTGINSRKIMLKSRGMKLEESKCCTAYVQSSSNRHTNYKIYHSKLMHTFSFNTKMHEIP